MNMNIKISASAARKRFDDLCLSANAKQQDISYLRQTEKGQQTVSRRCKLVSDGAQQTGKAIIQLYASRIKTLHGLMPQELAAGELPSLPTNNVKLAGYRQNVTDRTIRTHLTALKSVGFIVDYRFHGTKSDFEIWLNPSVILGPNYALTATPAPQFSEPNSTLNSNTNGRNFPLKHTIETNRNNNTTISKVEILNLYGKHFMATTPNSPKNAFETTLSHQNGNKKGAAAAAASVDNFVDNTQNRWANTHQSPTFDALHPVFYAAVREFFAYARQVLYHNRHFTDKEYTLAAEQITTGFYLPFIRTKPNAKQFAAYQSELLKALDIAAKYYDSHPERHPGEPYSPHGLATGYFDAANPRGFKIAIDWRFKNKAANDEAYGERVIAAAVRHLKGHATGNVPKALKTKTYLQLFDFYASKIQRFSPEIREKFTRRVAANINK